MLTNPRNTLTYIQGQDFTHWGPICNNLITRWKTSEDFFILEIQRWLWKWCNYAWWKINIAPASQPHKCTCTPRVTALFLNPVGYVFKNMPNAHGTYPCSSSHTNQFWELRIVLIGLMYITYLVKHQMCLESPVCGHWTILSATTHTICEIMLWFRCSFLSSLQKN